MTKRSRRYRHSLERNSRETVDEKAQLTREQAVERIEELRALTPAGQQSDSTALIRAERDRR